MTDARRPSSAARIRHGRQTRSTVARNLLAFVGIALCCVLVAGVSLAAIYTYHLGSNVAKNSVDIGGGKTLKAPTIGEYPGAFNVMLVGVDNDPSQSTAAYGKRGGAILNDVNILLHVSADRKSATAVSIPRDLVVPFPSCTSEDGKRTTSPASGLAFNNAYAYGGLKCVVAVAEKLSGLDIPFAGVVTFDGVVQLSTVVGGVDVCVNQAIKDPYTGLDLPAGHSSIQGAQAAAFVRSRHGVGDGSDLGRISSQQVFMSSLVRKLKSEGTLGDPSKLLQIAEVATTSMKLSTSLASPIRMVSIAQALRNIPLETVVFVQYPGSTGGSGIFTGKVQPNVSVATKMWSALKADQPIALDAQSVGAAGGSELDPTASQTPAPTGSASASPAPSDGTGSGTATAISGLKGQTAAQQTCSKAYSGG
ncbi:MAG: LCP family protein [Micrococcales bacterium]|nr:LCP family protein [Micrococcales bacterium]